VDLAWRRSKRSDLVLPFHRDQRSRSALPPWQLEASCPKLLQRSEERQIDHPACCFRPVQWRWAVVAMRLMVLILAALSPRPLRGAQLRPEGGCRAVLIDSPCQI